MGRRRESNTTDTKRAMKRERVVVEEREGVNLRVGGAMLSPLSHSHTHFGLTHTLTLSQCRWLSHRQDMNTPSFFIHFSFHSFHCVLSSSHSRIHIPSTLSPPRTFDPLLLSSFPLTLLFFLPPASPTFLSPTFFPVPFTPPWPFVLFLG